MKGAAHTVLPSRPAIRGRLSEHRAARRARRALRHDLATYTTASDLNDLYAMLDRYSPDETRDIRRNLPVQAREQENFVAGLAGAASR